MKRIIALVCVLTLTIGMASTVEAASWTTWINKTYESAVGSIKTSKHGFKAKLKSIGWMGCWGGQAHYNVYTEKGKKYLLKFTIKSSKIDKYVWVKIGNDSSSVLSFGKWIDCKKGKKIKIKKAFVAKGTFNKLSFGFGGDYGDRAGVSTDGDAKARYKYAPNKILDGRLGPGSSADHPTVISCDNLVIGEYNKIVRKINKSKVTVSKGKTVKLKISNTKAKIKWKSSNKKIATVNKKGLVKAKNVGKTVIKGRVKGKTYKCRVTVKKYKYVARYNKHHIKITAIHYIKNNLTKIKIKNKNKNKDVYIGRRWGADAILTLKTTKKTYVDQVDFLNYKYHLKPSYQELGPGMTFKYGIKGKGKPKYLMINGIMPMDSDGFTYGKKYIIKIKYK